MAPLSEAHLHDKLDESLILWEGIVLQWSSSYLLVHPHVIMVESEDAYPVVDVLQVAPSLEARKEIVKTLQSVFEGLVHPLDEVLQLCSIDVMFKPQPSTRF